MQQRPALYVSRIPEATQSPARLFVVTPLAPVPAAPADGHHPHDVAFYDAESSLVETTSAFIATALRDGDAAIVVATAAHRGAIDSALRDAGLDVEAAAADGRYVSVDAAELLGRIMVDGAPDLSRFAETVGATIEHATESGRGVRLFSEMVALLWDTGDLASAVTLEQLYNDLVASAEVSLLCAHPMRAFHDPAGADAFECICAQHASVIPCEGRPQDDGDPDDQQRVIARLQQEAGALRAARATARVDDLARMDHAERIAGVGTWERLPVSGDLHWSDNLFRIFGLEPQSVGPTVELVLDAAHPADRARLGEYLAAPVADRAPPTLDYRIVLADKTVRHLRTGAAFASGAGDLRRVVGSIQDVTSEHRTARSLAGHAAVSKALDEWDGFDPGVAALMAGFAGAMSLCAGTLWVPRHDTLIARLIWHEPSAPLMRFAAVARASRPVRASPNVRRAWKGGQPAVSNAPAAGVSPELAVALEDAGLTASVAIPAVVDGETLAVLEFLSVDRIEPRADDLRSLDGIGHEIGTFLGHLRGALSAPVLTPRGVEVLQLAAQAHSATEIALEMHVSPATVKRHFEDSYARLGVGDRAAAVAQAMRQGLIT